MKEDMMRFYSVEMIFWIFSSSLFALTLAEDYCNSQTFEASCPDGHVIRIQNATFGRMETGSCVTRNYGHLGCQADVKNIMENRCAGRRSCSVNVADGELEAAGACDTEFKSYLSIFYTCQEVVHVESCHQPGRISLTTQSGLLSNVITGENQCGANTRPWYIRTSEGQQIRFTLEDFHVQDPAPTTCHLYAVITEKSQPNTETICGGKERRSHVYTTSGFDAEVRINRLNTQEQSPPTYFLLKYEVIGCAHLVLPSPTVFERFDDRAFISCPDNSKRKYPLKCEGNQWQGRYRNCTENDDVTGVNKDGGPSLDAVSQNGAHDWLPFALDVSIALIFGVAFVISCCIFVVGIIIIRRQSVHRMRRQREAMIAMQSRDPSSQPMKYQDHQKSPYPYTFKDDVPQQGQQLPRGQHLGQHQGQHQGQHLHQGHIRGQQGRLQGGQPVENDYAYIADFPPPPSPKTLRKMNQKGGEKVTEGVLPSLGIHDFTTPQRSVLPLRSDLMPTSRNLNTGSQFDDGFVDQRKSL